MFDIVKVVLELQPRRIHRCDIALVNLCPAGQPRSYDVAIDVERNLALIPFRERYRLRTRSDPAHVSPHDIDDLRQLVETILAQEPAHPSNSLVALDRVIPSTMIVRHRP